MDDTQQSRASDAAAAATRKRRSSILKSQRPARTPFSELEFNVATPTDTAKSRRVSFSRRTGVAEFVTNEATTTWKNFYEEHNKSLESSSNDSEANASRQPVGHLGKRIFDQQFEEVEAVDFISGLANGSLNNVNFSQQLASLECTADGKLTAPQNKFELSAFTEQSKLFGNDFTAPSIGDNSGRIDVNFSAIQQIERDDLDEIEKDLERASSNMGCHGPFSNGQNMSEYIEVDLNMTHVVKNDEDMSITDTVHSPVQDVSKSASKDKKASLNNDWVADKENIAINPYADPCETNFAVNEDPDQVLVFDGKRLTLQPDIPEKDKNYRQTLLPNSSAETPQRKTIVLNVNDDLPNFVDDNNILNSKYENSGFSGFHEIKADEDEISETMSVHRVDIIPNKRKTIHDYSGNISMTQALPTNIICHAAVINQDVNSTKRRTIVFDESKSNISMTETIPVKLLNSSAALPERRRTVVYEDDTANISITQAVPSNILVNDNTEFTKKHKTIVFDSDEDNISMTQALSSNIIDEKCKKRKTIVFDDSDCNVSFTQALPANIMLPDKQTQEKRRTIIYENDTGNISVTQALPTNVILPKIEADPERRRTVLYEDDTANVSVTQALPSNIILEKYQIDDNNKNNEAEDILTTQSLSTSITTKDSETSERRPIAFANNTGNISITQAIPGQLILGYSEENPIYNNDEGDISMTEGISANIIEKAANERNTIVYDEDEANISMTLAISTNDYLLYKLNSAANIKTPEDIEEVTKVNDYVVFEQDYIKPTEDALQDKRKSSVFDANNLITEMAMTTAHSSSSSLPETEKSRNTVNKTVIFDNDNCDISKTKPIPAEFITAETEMLNITETKEDVMAQNQRVHPQLNIIVMQTSLTNSKQPINVEKAHDSKVELPIKLSNGEKVQVKLTASTDPTDQNIDKSIGKSLEAIKALTDSTDPNTDKVVRKSLETIKASTDSIDSNIDKFIRKSLEASKASTDSADQNIDKVFVGDDDATKQTGDEESKASLIIASEPYWDSDTDDKSLMANLESNSSSTDVQMDGADNNSTTTAGSMFYITKDCEAVIQTDSSNEAQTVKLKIKENELVQVGHFEKKLAELQSDVFQNSNLSNDYVRRLSHISDKANDTQNLLDLICNLTGDTKDSENDIKPGAIEVNDQGETTEHKRFSVAPNRQSIALSREDLLSNISMAQAALQKSRLALDDSDVTDEDTRNNSIDTSKNSDHTRDDSIDTSKNSEHSRDASLDMSKNSGQTRDASPEMSRNSGRTSYEVVKTLKFDDESTSEASLKDEEKISPLKKTVFGETSHVKETKGKVIPTYLKDVSDGIKELMLDLIKPVSDNMPFINEVPDRGLFENVSTHSTQVQANLTTSSQIDLDYDLVSVAGVDLDTISSSNSATDRHPEKSKSRVSRNQVKFSFLKETEKPEERWHEHSHSDSPIKQPPPPEVLVFDRHNPLNNVLLAPIHLTDVHKYNPRQTDETLCESRSSRFNNMSKGHNYEVETVTTPQFTLMPGQSVKQENIYVYHGEQFSQNDVQSLQTFTTSDETSVDQLVDTSVASISKHLKDDEVNTLIAMRGNKELLQASSSLTLVDDLPECEKSKLTSKKEHSRTSGQTSEIHNMTALSGISLRDNFEGSDLCIKTTKGKKRIYSPSTNKHKYNSPSREVTPKPIMKMQKISRSPKPPKELIKVSPKNTHSTQINNQKTHQSNNREKKSPKSNNTKSGQPSITVQQLITDFQNFETELKHNVNLEKKLDDLNLHPKSGSTSAFSNSDASFTSSKDLKSMKDDNSTGTGAVQQLITDYQNFKTELEHNIDMVKKLDDLNTKSESTCSQSDASFTSSKKNLKSIKDNQRIGTELQAPHQAPVQDAPWQMDWQPQLMGTTSSNISDIDSGVNVVAKIDMLPFMGSHECEWDSRSVADTWSFRLQHGRLRLTARLAHRHDNATRTRVRGDTPVMDIMVETVQHDRKNPVATLCVRFACETMRYMVAQALHTPCYAKDIPQLLRRCAAVTRVALRWGRAMHDAKLQLAYTMDNNGNISLKVANVRLRSVWEVTMHIELIVDDNLAVPWPRAEDVRVTRVVSELHVPDADVQRVLANIPRDWGHAPRTVWRIFRYLKHKTRDDNLILA